MERQETRSDNDSVYSANYGCKTEKTPITTGDCTDYHRSKLSVFLMILSIYGILYNVMLSNILVSSMGVVYVELVKIFGISRTEASVLMTIYKPVATCTSLFNVFLVRKYGIGQCLIVGSVSTCVGFLGASFTTTSTQIILVLGMVTSYGNSYIYMCSLMTPPYLVKSEKPRNALTTALVIFCGIGTSIGGPLMSYVLENYGLNISMIIYAGLCLLSFIGNVGVLLRLRISSAIQEDNSSSNVKQSCSTLLEIFSKASFVAFFCLEALRIAFYQVFLNFLVDHVYTRGFSLATAASLTSLMGIGGIFGRIVNGIVITVKRWRGIYQYSLTIIVFGLCIMSASLAVTYASLVVACLCAGFTSGMLTSLQYLLPYELVETEQYSIVISASFTLYGVTTVITSPLAGWIRDTYNSYESLFFAAFPVCGIPGAMVFLCQLWNDYCKRAPSKVEEKECLIGDNVIMDGSGESKTEA